MGVAEEKVGCYLRLPAPLPSRPGHPEVQLVHRVSEYREMEPVSVRIERMDLATLPRMPAQGEDQLIGYPGRMNAGDKTVSKGVKNERRGELQDHTKQPTQPLPTASP